MADEITEPVADAADPELTDLLDTPSDEEGKAAAAAPAPEPEAAIETDTPSEAAPVAAVPPAAAPAAVEAPKPAEKQPSAAEKRLAELKAMVSAEDFDPYSKEGREAYVELADVAAEVKAEPLREQLHNATVWTTLAETHELPVKDLKTTWAAVCKDLPDREQAVREYEFERRIKEAKAKPATEVTPPAAPAPKPVPPNKQRVPIAPRPGAVSPPGVSGHRPPPPTNDPGEQFDKSVTKEDLASLV